MAGAGAVMLWDGARSRDLEMVRVVVFACWLVVVAFDPLGYLADLPREMGHPVGVFRWVPALSGDALEGLRWTLVVLAAVCIWGRWFRVVGPVTVALLTVQQALLREPTFNNHEELALLLVSWVLVLGWPRRSVLVVMTGALLVPYCLIAAHRLAFGGADVFVGESLPYWLASLHSLDREGWGVGLWALEHPWLVVLLKLGFFVTTVFELLAPLCLISVRFARVWAVVVIGFHVVNWFTLNLFFWQNAVLVGVLVIGGSVRSRPELIGRSTRSCG